MMRRGTSAIHHLVAQLDRERNIDHRIAVNMPDFALPDAELRPTEAVRMR